MIPLATGPLQEQVEALRPHVAGCACVVVGSAPLKTQTATVQPGEVLMAVNGGIASLPGRVAHVWVMNSKAQDRPGSLQLHEMHRLMLAQAERSATDHLLLLRGPKVSSEEQTLETLLRRKASWQTWSVLDKPTKLWVERELCGRVEDKAPCSSGMLTVACALWCGAASVRLAGFSLKPGYHYIRTGVTPQNWWRNHVEADKQAIRKLCQRYPGRLSGSIVPTDLAVAS